MKERGHHLVDPWPPTRGEAHSHAEDRGNAKPGSPPQETVQNVPVDRVTAQLVTGQQPA